MPSLSEFLGQPSVEISDENLSGRTDADREAEAIGEVSDVRYCACGCGEKLSPNTHGNVKYLPRHKLGKTRLPKDPDRPAGSEKKTAPTFVGDRLPANVKKDIQEKCEFLLTILGMTWQSRDPICGTEFADRSDQIAEKLVPLIARNATLLKWFSSEGSLPATLDLAMVLFPIAKTVAQHHIFKSIGHEEIGETVPNNFMYPVD